MGKVLVIAYACEPGKGSEPAVGWNWAMQIAKNFETWIITRKSNRKAIEEFFSGRIPSNIHFEYVDLPRPLLFWKKGEMTIRFYYLLWQILAFFKGLKLHRKERFDIVHHLTFLVDWLPPLAAFLPANFVWGPIGGTSRKLLIPFFKEFGVKNSLYEIFRSLYLNLFTPLNPLINFAKKKARFILRSIPDGRPDPKTRIISAIGISPEEIPEQRKKFERFTVFITGRMTHWKGFSLAIKAFHNFSSRHKNTQMLIGGKGKEYPKLKKLVEKLALQDRVKFVGYLPSREHVFKLMQSSHVFILPTLRDAPLVSFLEAMACGIPVICIDIPAQQSVVCDDCGIRVPMAPPKDLINYLAEALEMLYLNPGLRERMGKKAKERALKEFSWTRKGEFIKELYMEILRDENPHSA